jgi:hypothetical protein
MSYDVGGGAPVVHSANGPLGQTATSMIGIAYSTPPTGGTAVVQIQTGDSVVHEITLPFDADGPTDVQDALDTEFGAGICSVNAGQWPAEGIQVEIVSGYGLLSILGLNVLVAGLTGGTDVVADVDNSIVGSEGDPVTIGLPIGSHAVRTDNGQVESEPLNIWFKARETGPIEQRWIEIWASGTPT